MNINVAISIRNEIIREGIANIISHGVITSRCIFIEKEMLLESIEIKKIHFAIIDDVDLINYSKMIINCFSKGIRIKFFVLTNKKFSSKRINLFNNYSITVLNSNKSSNEILSIIKDSIFNEKKIKTSTKIKNKINEEDPTKLLSNREMEIALLLLKGYTSSEISKKNNISLSTVSTYRSRIFQKTKARNIMQISNLFK